MLTINVETAGDHPVRRILLVEEGNIQAVELAMRPWGGLLRLCLSGGGDIYLDDLAPESAVRLLADIEKAMSAARS